MFLWVGFFFPPLQDFWREPKSAADGRRMRLGETWGELLEGEPGSWRFLSAELVPSAPDEKRGRGGDGLLHMLFAAMPNGDKVPARALRCRRHQKGEPRDGWRTAQKASGPRSKQVNCPFSVFRIKTGMRNLLDVSIEELHFRSKIQSALVG